MSILHPTIRKLIDKATEGLLAKSGQAALTDVAKEVAAALFRLDSDDMNRALSEAIYAATEKRLDERSDEGIDEDDAGDLVLSFIRNTGPSGRTYESVYRKRGTRLHEIAKRKVSLQMAQRFVGGNVERVVLGDGRVLLVNEDGIGQGLPVNLEATRLAGVPIHGEVVLLSETALEGWVA